MSELLSSYGIVVLGTITVGGLVVVKVIWSKLTDNLLNENGLDGYQDNDGTGYIWRK